MTTLLERAAQTVRDIFNPLTPRQDNEPRWRLISKNSILRVNDCVLTFRRSGTPEDRSKAASGARTAEIADWKQQSHAVANLEANKQLIASLQGGLSDATSLLAEMELQLEIEASRDNAAMVAEQKRKIEQLTGELAAAKAALPAAYWQAVGDYQHLVTFLADEEMTLAKQGLAATIEEIEAAVVDVLEKYARARDAYDRAGNYPPVESVIGPMPSMAEAPAPGPVPFGLRETKTMAAPMPSNVEPAQGTRRVSLPFGPRAGKMVPAGTPEFERLGRLTETGLASPLSGKDGG